jgi:broad-specificity NMP kinase
MIEMRMGRHVGDTFEIDDRKAASSKFRWPAGRGLVVYGHFVPGFIRRSGIGMAVVLRCEPKILKRRLLSRGYDVEKIRDNLEAELIGVSLAGCLERFGEEKVIQFDTTRTRPHRAANSILRTLRSPSKRLSKSLDKLDWTGAYTSATKLTSLLGFESTDVGLI